MHTRFSNRQTAFGNELQTRLAQTNSLLSEAAQGFG
jgi:hypothetical protein